MQTEPITVPRATREQAAAVSQPAPIAAAIDEAFATVSDTDLRVDDSHGAAAARGEDARPMTAVGGFAAELRDQLQALDAQREQLARLLDGLRS